jgi:hypothetical protein
LEGFNQTFFLVKGPQQQTLRTHRSLEASCATCDEDDDDDDDDYYYYCLSFS